MRHMKEGRMQELKVAQVALAKATGDADGEWKMESMYHSKMQWPHRDRQRLFPDGVGRSLETRVHGLVERQSNRVTFAGKGVLDMSQG